MKLKEVLEKDLAIIIHKHQKYNQLTDNTFFKFFVIFKILCKDLILLLVV